MHDFSFQAMGTDCTISLDGVDEARAAEAAQAGIDEVDRLEAKYSRYRADSVLSRINGLCGCGGEAEIDAETSFLLDYAARAHEISAGAFDITSGILRRVWREGADAASIAAGLEALLPRVGFDKLIRGPATLRFALAEMEIDLGGLVKEYAADRAAAACRGLGATSGLVNLGGDIAIVGPRPDGAVWPIALADPFGTGATAGTCEIGEGGLATSGDAERWITVEGRRYGHILDARTGWPVEGLSSVTVRADTALLAGTLSTLAMLRGRAGADWLAACGCAHLAIGTDGTVRGCRDMRHP